MNSVNNSSGRFIPENSFFEKFIDNVIENADDYNFFSLDELIDSFKIDESDKNVLSLATREFENFLRKKNIVETNRKLNLTLNLTDFGRECKKVGGYSNFLKSEQDKADLEHFKEERKEKAEQLDITKKKWDYRNRRWPYILSSLALIGSLISIIVNYKPKTNKEDLLYLQPMKSEIQVLQAKVKEIDSLIRMDTLLKKRMK